jgi:uncharacterized protein YbjT (DUF2867 family)
MIAVTGSTGRVGSLVAARLAAAGVEQRLVVRDVSRAPSLPHSSVVAASYGDFAAASRALAGVDVLFMVSAAEEADRVATHRSFVDAAVAAGVRHVVYTSFYGASPTCTFTLGRDHYATEEHLRASGCEWTFLRDNFYLDVLPLFAGADGVIRGPAGTGRVAGVAIADVADAATAVLRSPASHAGHTYSLTGPESLSLSAAAAILGLTYHAESLAEAHRSRSHYGAPPWQVEAWISTYTAIASGELSEVTEDVRHLTGHPPRSLSDLAATLIQ